jgi:hypothetical protein
MSLPMMATTAEEKGGAALPRRPRGRIEDEASEPASPNNHGTHDVKQS